MAKTASTWSRSPFSFLTGEVVTKDDLRRVHEMQNYARCEAVQNLVGGDGTINGSTMTGSRQGPSPHGPVYWPASGPKEVYRFAIYIDPDIDSLAIRTVATMPGGASGDVDVTIGGATVSNAHAAGSTTTTDGTLATSATGTGWQLCIVELTQVSGDPSTATLDRWRVRTVPITVTALPDPALT